MSHVLRTAFAKRASRGTGKADETVGTPKTETEKSTPAPESQKEEVKEVVDHATEVSPKNEVVDGQKEEHEGDRGPSEKQEKETEVTEQDKTGSGDNDGDSKYPSGTKLGFLTFGLAMATFVIALDNTIIATAIPRITTDFDSLNDVGWYGSSYLLTTTSLQPSFGKVYTYFDVKWVYLSALMIFERMSSHLIGPNTGLVIDIFPVGSIICAAATGSTMLVRIDEALHHC